MQGASRLVCAPFHKLSSLADADGPSCDASDAMRERGFGNKDLVYTPNSGCQCQPRQSKGLVNECFTFDMSNVRNPPASTASETTARPEPFSPAAHSYCE